MQQIPLFAAFRDLAFLSTDLIPRGAIHATDVRPERLNIKSVIARVEKNGDLWADFWNRRQRIEEAVEALASPPRSLTH